MHEKNKKTVPEARRGLTSLSHSTSNRECHFCSPNCSTYDDASCQVVSNWTSAVLMPRLCKRANNLRRFTLSKARLRSRQICNPPYSLCLGIPAALECGVALCWRRRFLTSAQCMHTLRIASMVDLPVIYAKIGNCTICSYASVMAK